MQTIKNDKLTVQINPKGAELWSIKDASGKEYLWQGDPAVWKDRAPNLFPYIGRMPGKRYTFEGKEYHMDIHGFAKNCLMEVACLEESRVVYRLEDNEETYSQYPFHFCLEITYALEDNRILISTKVQNKDQGTMYFALGGHPGFNVPMEEGLSFTDYYLNFKSDKARKVEFSADGFTKETHDYDMPQGTTIPLTHPLFDNDAIVVTDLPMEVELISDKGTRGVRVCSPDMKYIGFWQMAFIEPQYLCIEPWSALPSRDGIVEDLATQPNLTALASGETYNNVWSIEIF